MSPPLTVNQRIFIEKMKADSESTMWGFERLLEVPHFTIFFDALDNAGLFDATNNPAPISTEDGQYWTIPHWPALDYLEKCAKESDEKANTELAHKVARVVKRVSKSVRENSGPDNYRTFYKFAEIVGLLPLPIVDRELLELAPVWLTSKFDRGLVANAFDIGFLRRALASDNPTDWSNAVLILRYCTALNPHSNHDSESNRKSIVDDYWLKELIEHHAMSFGRRIGSEASALMLDRTREAYSDGTALSSTLYRPAIEEHEQNHDWRGVQNSFVEGTRDILLSWVDQEPTAAGDRVIDLIKDEAEIVRRIAIYVVNEKWSLLRDRFVLSSQLFSFGHLHELYNLLKARFSSFSSEQKKQTLDAISALASSSNQDERSTKRNQRQWLSAVAGQGYDPADTWYHELNRDQAIGELFEHPDFLAYTSSGWGYGATPFEAAELVAFAQDRTLVSRLNSFKEPGDWRGPSIRSLSDALAEAVKLNPTVFVETLPDFINANRPYQHGVINGFKSLWSGQDGAREAVHWGTAWPALITFFEALVINDPSFWAPDESQGDTSTPKRDWLVALIADFLTDGTKNDDRAFAAELLPRSWKLILALLERTEASPTPSDDPMSHAINSNKGKAIEALVNQALRECRIADKEAGSHAAVWQQVAPPFDLELSKCRNGNYEFSTLAGSFFANLHYLSADWLAENVERIFPREYPDNFICALGGLAYAPAMRKSYSLLNEKGLIEHALGLTPKGRHTRENLIERIALAYLWGDEFLDSPRFGLIFANKSLEDLQQIAAFFGRVKSKEFEEIQQERVRDFLRRSLEVVSDISPPPSVFLGHLSRLIFFVGTLGDEEIRWLVTLAPYAGRDLFASEFAEQLTRLLPQDPKAIVDILQAMVTAPRPYTDYKGRLRTLLVELAKHGQRPAALRLANQMRDLKSMPEVFAELSSNNHQL